MRHMRRQMIDSADYVLQQLKGIDSTLQLNYGDDHMLRDIVCVAYESACKLREALEWEEQKWDPEKGWCLPHEAESPWLLKPGPVKTKPR